MNSLNTDCLIEIIKLLNLKDQISLYQVSDSLQVAVTTFWRMKFKHVHINFLEVSLTNKEFTIFLETLQDIMEKLQLRFLNKENYDVLKRFCFERVNNFRFTLSKPYFLADSDIKDLRKSLPNLTAFSPHGNISGRYMEEWPLLKDLNLSFCCKLATLPFQTILSHLKLEKLILNIFPNIRFEEIKLVGAQVQNLKYLQVNAYELFHFLSQPLTALKELIITNYCNPSELFHALLSIWQAKDIRLLETGNVNNILANCVESHLNIEKLSVVNDETALPSHIIPSLHLLTDLRKLRFISCFIESKDFINLLKNINQVLEISFENCLFDAANICLKVDDVFANRQAILRLNMFENRLIDNSPRPIWCKETEKAVCVSVDVIGNRSLLELTHCKGDALHYEPFYIAYR